MHAKHPLILLLALAIALHASLAHAHDRSADQPETHREWYGSQVLAADLTSLVLMTPTMGVSATGYLVGGPLVHTRHSGPGRGLISVGLRVSLPAAGIGLALATDAHDDDLLRTAIRAYGFGLLGALGAAAVDSAFAHKTVVVEPERTRPFSPVVRVTPRGTTLGLSGQF